ncbi:hypothetical protein BVY03_00540 [bacterium K02(2017)]|nr:hypothetical protein BVY03_00540 [bacterium K02(2017)]
MIDDEEFMLELQNDFLEEARELLEKTENQFLDFEKNPTDPNIIIDIFRLAHTLKGSAAAVGFEELTHFAHNMENLLVKLRENELNASPRIIDILLKSNDLLKVFVNSLSADKNSKVDASNLNNLIKSILESPKTENKTPTIPTNLKSTSQDSEIFSNFTNKEQQNTKPSKPDEFIKLPISKIENLLNAFGEQVILQSSLEHYSSNIHNNSDAILKTIAQLNKLTYDLQQSTIALRMVSLKPLFNKMQRPIRDGAKALNKEVDFIMNGQNTELDKSMVDELSSPLTHLLRNAIDHGIEEPHDREKKGKPRKGTITMTAEYKGRYFFLTIEDDGKGLDKEIIRKKAIEKSLITKDQQLSEKEIMDLIFLSGFSTKEKATDLSGRGVGMDAVKNAVENLKGTIELESKLEHGSKVTIKLPPTLAIFNGFVTHIAGKEYIIPNSEISELLPINMDISCNLNTSEKMIEIKEEVYPLIHIQKILGLKQLPNKNHSKQKNKPIMLAIKINEKRFGLLVDDVLTQQRIVFKDLGHEVSGLPGIAGGTILGDGQVALILDLHEIINMHQKGTAHG